MVKFMSKKEKFVKIYDLSVSNVLLSFVNKELLPGTNISKDHFWKGNEEKNKRRIRFMRIMACLSFLFLGGWKGIGRRKNTRQGDRMYNFHNGIYEVS